MNEFRFEMKGYEQFQNNPDPLFDERDDTQPPPEYTAPNSEPAIVNVPLDDSERKTEVGLFEFNNHVYRTWCLISFLLPWFGYWR